MVREGQIDKLLKEAAVEKAPEGFTDSVMLHLMPITAPAYKPLISKSGWTGIIILLLLTVLAIILLLPSSWESTGIFSKIAEFQLPKPEWSFSLDFLRDLQLSKGVVSALIAGLLLVFMETLFAQRRSIH